MLINRLKKNLSLVFALFLLVLASYLIYKFGSRIEAEQIRFFVAQFGVAGPIVYIVLVVLSIVIAPIQGWVIWLGGFFAFGMPMVIIYSWIAGNIGAAIAFLIAKRWGRPVIKTLVGRQVLARIDEISENIGLIMLFILRVFQASLFDTVSYAAGLTNIGIRAYMVVTLVGTAFPALLFLLFYDALTKQNWSIFGILAVWGLVGWGLASIPVIWYFFKKPRQ